ncbi:radical SAM protein [candidate division KSB1 bacterium]|nr:MAG: radical SAM protein [candidate division KSB1 bacterium]
MNIYTPGYVKLLESGELDDRISSLKEKLKKCNLCPHKCGIDRTAGEKGICKADESLYVSSAFPHFGEEAPLVGKYGSGTIFFTHCNLRCIFCQNYDISHYGEGKKTSIEKLAEYMLDLQKNKCHNINIVTPTHYVPQLVEGLKIAAENGLKIPLVYNCGGYESVETLKLLKNIVDIYMPDAKFSSNEIAKKYTTAPDYYDILKKALKEMHKQVGDLKIDSSGIAYKGLLIRHLVMPNNVAGSEKLINFIANNLSKNSYVNIMAQYRPLHLAHRFNKINRKIYHSEFNEVIKIARNKGLFRGFNEDKIYFILRDIL